MPSAVVIGADGLIGSALLRRLRERGWTTVGTTRRPNAAAALERFDLSDPPEGLARKLRCDVAFLTAAITGYARCEADPEGTRRINVANSIALASELGRHGAFVVYPSSSAVLGEAADPCNESTPPSPTTEYGRQKADAERGILNLGGGVVRLTKVVASSGLVGNWMGVLRSGGTVEAATNLVFSPISLPYAVRGLIDIAQGGRSGVYHLAGEEVLSYCEFALRLAEALGASRAQVRPAEVASAKNSPVLDMSKTSEYIRTPPQRVDSVISDLVRFGGATTP